MIMKRHDLKQGNAASTKRRSQTAEIWHNFCKNKGAIVGLVVMGIIVLAAILSAFLIDFDTQIARQVISERLQKPSSEHFFGTDQYGLEIFLRDLYGAQYSLSVGVVAVLISTVFGVTLGVIAGYDPR